MAHALRPTSFSSSQLHPAVLSRNDRVSSQAKIISLIAVNVLVAFVSFVYLPWQAALGVTLATSFFLLLINASRTAPASASGSSQVVFRLPNGPVPVQVRPSMPAAILPQADPLSNAPIPLPPASINPRTGVVSQPVVDRRRRENVETGVSSRSHFHRAAPLPSYAPAAFPSVAAAPVARPAQSTSAQLPREPVERPRAIMTSSSPQGGSIVLNRGEERRRGNKEGSASLFARAHSLPEEQDTDSPAPPRFHAQFSSQDFSAATNQTPTDPSAPPLPKKQTRELVGQRPDTR